MGRLVAITLLILVGVSTYGAPPWPASGNLMARYLLRRLQGVRALHRPTTPRTPQDRGGKRAQRHSPTSPIDKSGRPLYALQKIRTD